MICLLLLPFFSTLFVEMFMNKKFLSALIWTFLLRIKFLPQRSAIILSPNTEEPKFDAFWVRDEKNCLVTVSLFACKSPIIIYWYAHQCLNSETGQISLGKQQGVLSTVLKLDMWPNTVNLKFNSLLLHTNCKTPWTLAFSNNMQMPGTHSGSSKVKSEVGPRQAVFLKS